MGTSKKYMNNQIKKLLKEKHLDDLNKTAPDITKFVLSKELLTKQFDDEQTINNSIEIVTKHFISLGESGYKGKSKKELLDDNITLQDFLEMVLEEINSESNVDSRILKKSLRVVMTKLLKEDTEDPYVFAQLLFHQVTYKLLEKELYETLKDSYEELSYDKIKIMVVNLTDKIMNKEVYQNVNYFVDKKISLSQLLDIIAEATDDAEFGEF